VLVAPHRRKRPRTDDTNWGPRDDVRWYTDQAKGAVGAAGEIARMPRTWMREVRGMFREMRDDPAPPPENRETPRSPDSPS
jgi:hypothetical protein